MPTPPTTEPTKRIRGRRLQEIRAAHLREHPFCKRCLELGRHELGEEVDHVVPLFKGGKEEPSNRQTLCKPHHDEKSLRDLGHTRRPTIGRDGWPVSAEEELRLMRRRRSGMRR